MNKHLTEAITIIEDVRKSMPECANKAFLKGAVIEINSALIKTESGTEIRNLYNVDFKKYYDSAQKRNIWVLGYFGGGSVNVLSAYIIGVDYANKNNVSIDTVQIDEILSSSRHRGFKFVYSTVIQDPDKDAEIMDNVYQWLRD